MRTIIYLMIVFAIFAIKGVHCYNLIVINEFTTYWPIFYGFLFTVGIVLCSSKTRLKSDRSSNKPKDVVVVVKTPKPAVPTIVKPKSPEPPAKSSQPPVTKQITPPKTESKPKIPPNPIRDEVDAEAPIEICSTQQSEEDDNTLDISQLKKKQQQEEKAPVTVAKQCIFTKEQKKRHGIYRKERDHEHHYWTKDSRVIEKVYIPKTTVGFVQQQPEPKEPTEPFVLEKVWFERSANTITMIGEDIDDISLEDSTKSDDESYSSTHASSIADLDVSKNKTTTRERTNTRNAMKDTTNGRKGTKEKLTSKRGPSKEVIKNGGTSKEVSKRQGISKEVSRNQCNLKEVSKKQGISVKKVGASKEKVGGGSEKK